jgi:hypothetical protein
MACQREELQAKAPLAAAMEMLGFAASQRNSIAELEYFWFVFHARKSWLSFPDVGKFGREHR